MRRLGTTLRGVIVDPIAVDDEALLYWSLRCRIRVAATPVAATFDIDVLGTYARRKIPPPGTRSHYGDRREGAGTAVGGISSALVIAVVSGTPKFFREELSRGRVTTWDNFRSSFNGDDINLPRCA